MSGRRSFGGATMDHIFWTARRKRQASFAIPLLVLALLSGSLPAPPLSRAALPGPATQSLAFVAPAVMNSAPAQQGQQSPGSATITASKDDTLAVDVNGNTRANPGDTLGYTVTINNSGTGDAT